jgi:hypothetical protein
MLTLLAQSMPTRSLVVSEDQTVLNHLKGDLHGPAPPERRLKPMSLSIAVVAASIGFGSVIWPAQAGIAKPVTIAVLNDKTSVFSDAGGSAASSPPARLRQCPWQGARPADHPAGHRPPE